MKNRDDLIAWAWSELDRVTAQASRIDDTSSERYGKAVALVNDLLILTFPPMPYEFSPCAAPTTTPAKDAPSPGDGSGADAEEPEASPETTKAEEPEAPAETPAYTLPQVRTKLAEAKRKGIALPELFQEFGASSIMSVPSTDYGALMARVAELLESVE